MAEVVVVVVVDSVVKSDRSGMVRDETETEGPRTNDRRSAQDDYSRRNLIKNAYNS